MKSLGVREMGRGVFGGCDARRQDTCWVCTHQTASFKSGDITQKFFFGSERCRCAVAGFFFLSSSGGLRFMRYRSDTYICI